MGDPAGGSFASINFHIIELLSSYWTLRRRSDSLRPVDTKLVKRQGDFDAKIAPRA